MKRVKAACILQTLVFAQRPELGLSPQQALEINKKELESYIKTLERTNTRYQITETEELEDGSVTVHVRKQYNEKSDVSEYFV